uniref:Uncharacterized protein n=1 Tax=Brassica oleracea TaxID=3712 RepID=A0A3P6DM46_BRAOL|nr:unnamed protein product [Brassica oleracea]
MKLLLFVRCRPRLRRMWDLKFEQKRKKKKKEKEAHICYLCRLITHVHLKKCSNTSNHAAQSIG